MSEVSTQTPGPLTLSAYFIIDDDDGYRGGKSEANAVGRLEKVDATPIAGSNAPAYASS